jgi:hypothetical protein
MGFALNRLPSTRSNSESFVGLDFAMSIPYARELPITLDLPASLLRQIGKVIITYAALEAKMSRMIYSLLNVDPIAGRLAVRDPRTTDRLDLISDLLKLADITVKADISAIKIVLTKCARERDALAHGLWFRDPKHPGKLFLRLLGGTWTPPGSRGKSKRRTRPEAREYSTQDVKDVFELIEATGQQIYDLSDEIDTVLKASRG